MLYNLRVQPPIQNNFKAVAYAVPQLIITSNSTNVDFHNILGKGPHCFHVVRCISTLTFGQQVAWKKWLVQE